jgi:hypothetical protein
MTKKYILLFSIFTLSIQYSFANQALWQFNKNNELFVAGVKKIIPEKYLIAKLATEQFQLFQQTISLEESGKSQLIDLPAPDGSMIKFRIFEAPMMEKGLAVKFPMIKTYTAIALHDEFVTAKIDFTLHGFHAMVFDSENTYFIDPYTNENSDYYVVYYKHDFKKPLNQHMQCEMSQNADIHEMDKAISLIDDGVQPTQYSYKQNGASKRTYRLALACTIEYALAVNGPIPTKAGVLSAMTTSVNRVNGVFEREFSTHVNLVNNNDLIIWVTAPDVYSNTSGSTMLGQNQTEIDAKIGNANYDYGHVFSTGGGGIASLACVCSSSSKANGVTGSSNPVGDPFDIDYVAHEMGHQFGGSHTFNSASGSCTTERSSTSAYEIGSGTTIQAYAGLCGSDDIQTSSDDYYHLRSLEQMTGNGETTTSGIMACAVKIPSNNSLPTLASINNTFIIPTQTSFELKASGTDADGNPIKYCWEEFDLSSSGTAWDAVGTTNPMFRSFFPSANPNRTFPMLKELLKNTISYKGEVLPSNARILKFKCTLRDINNGNGAFYTSTDFTKVDVRLNASLFRVTSQNTSGLILPGNSTQSISWDVAATDVAPFLATKVSVYLSVDSGKSFFYTLQNNIDNNGSATVTIPNGIKSKYCRFKVKADNNIFFDLNDKFFEITDPTGINAVDDLLFNLYPNPANDKVTISLSSNMPKANIVVTNSLGAQILAQEIKKEIQINMNKLPRGIYFIKINTPSGQWLAKKLILE